MKKPTKPKARDTRLMRLMIEQRELFLRFEKALKLLLDKEVAFYAGFGTIQTGVITAVGSSIAQWRFQFFCIVESEQEPPQQIRFEDIIGFYETIARNEKYNPKDFLD